MGLSTLGTAQYTLTVEATPAAVMPDATTYRFYVNFDDANDQISAVFGNVDFPLEVNVPEGAFNTALNSSWNASGINNSFVAIFPELADDSFATLGLAGPASTSGIEGAADPQLAEDAAQPITPFFNIDGATSLLSNSVIGASWFTINTAQNAYAGDDLALMVMQVTTTGGISGTLNFQLFNQFDPSPDAVTEAVQLSVAFDGAGTFSPAGEVAGCTDAEACNYDSGATNDDGSCEYFDVAAGECDCDGNVLDAVGECGGECAEDLDNNGVCDGSEVYGCINPIACNYDAEANVDDGTCIGFPDFYCDCESTIPDTDNDGVCDEDEVAGCQDPLACNFDPAATDADDSCEYCSCAESAYTLTVDSFPATQPGLTTYRFYVNMLDSSDQLSAVYSTPNDPLVIAVPDGAFNSIYSSTWNASGVNPASLLDFPELVDDTYATIGLDGPAAPLGSEYQDPLVVDTLLSLINFFTVDGDTGFVADADPGVSWFVLPTAVNGLPDDDGQVFVMQITTSGNVSGILNYQIFPQGNPDDVAYVTASFDGVGTFGQVNVCGCTSSIACNYNPDATIDDGSCDFETCVGCTDETACNYDETATLPNDLCEYPDEGFNCDGSCIDSNDNGTCDSEEIAGCTDPDGCNYDETATLDDGSCEGPELAYQDCDGNCLNDADGDGVCDEEEIEGCTNEGACNYDVYATDDDGTCEYESCAGCTDEGACNYDADATILDDSCEYDSCAGCTDAEACNYDADATILDDSCDYESCAGCTEDGACNYDETATIDDGSCEYDSCAGCTDDTACNYDESATIEDDDACEFPGDECDDEDPTTINDALNDNCECVGIVDGIAEATLDFGMFPNPTTGEVTLSMVGFHTGVTIQVMDASGRAVWSQQNLVLQGNKVLDLSGLSSGTYNVMLSDERGVSVKRLAIQR